MHPPTPHSVPLPLLLLLDVLLFLTTTSTVTARAYTPQPPPNTNPIGASYIAFTTPTSNEEDVLFSPSSPLLPAGGGGGKGDVPSFSPPVIISDYACPWGKTLLCCAGAIFPGPDEEWGDYIGDCRLYRDNPDDKYCKIDQLLYCCQKWTKVVRWIYGEGCKLLYSSSLTPLFDMRDVGEA